ncbi:MAG: hypothetical protein ACREML_06575 [Vulcanimicrobiaceae bacterium]
MAFADIRALIDAELESDPRLEGSRHDLEGQDSIWRLNGELVSISASGTTGILVEYVTKDRLIDKRTFAMSTMIVERIVHTVAEHLSEYVYHEKQPS